MTGCFFDGCAGLRAARGLALGTNADSNFMRGVPDRVHTVVRNHVFFR